MRGGGGGWGHGQPTLQNCNNRVLLRTGEDGWGMWQTPIAQPNPTKSNRQQPNLTRTCVRLRLGCCRFGLSGFGWVRLGWLGFGWVGSECVRLGWLGPGGGAPLPPPLPPPSPPPPQSFLFKRGWCGQGPVHTEVLVYRSCWRGWGHDTHHCSSRQC